MYDWDLQRSLGGKLRDVDGEIVDIAVLIEADIYTFLQSYITQNIDKKESYGDSCFLKYSTNVLW